MVTLQSPAVGCEFAGQVAVVSGAASGIGLAVSLALARAGATVAALDCDEALLRALDEERSLHQLPIHTYVCDVAEPLIVKDVITRVTAELGAPVLLANVAGILRKGTASSVSLSDWNDSFRVNVTGVMLLAQTVVPSMIAQRRGAIVTVASNAGTTPRSTMCAYSASKAAALMYTRCLGLELAQHNIRCNSVSPGSTETPMLTQLLGDTPDVHTKAILGSPEQFRLGIPLRRVASVTDVCEAVLYLLSKAARHITMHNLIVDGGATLGS
jgi:2,3-dihydro-2,3-dihydroxybenzoate dehydrogenase